MLPSEEIKSRINIVDLIGEYVPLKKAGVNFRAPCPFHQEKTPSFIVSPAKQIWHCFGCSLGGDVFEFIKQVEGVEFPEALEILARRVGVTLQRPTTSYQAQTDQKKILLEINDLAARFYAKVLADSQAAQIARDYLAKRGLKTATIQKWQLGYAPNDFHVFENFIVKRGFQKREAAEAGLLIRKEDGTFFDRFRGRIMFPLFDIHGRVVGFTARILDAGRPDLASGQAKYINSPETAIYSKSQLIYGLHLAKTEIRKANEVIVVEGNVDVITCHEAAPVGGQAGFSNVVGSSGTAFTARQLELLKRFTENLNFAFDTDEAGLIATRRAVELALTLGFNVKVTTIPKSLAKDPDELIRRDPSLWQTSLTAAKNFLDFYFERVFAKIDLESSTEKKQAVSELLPLVSLLPDPIVRGHYVNLLATRIGADPRIVLDLLNKLFAAKKDRPGEGHPKAASPQRTKREILERRVLGLYLKFAQNLSADWQNLQEEDFSDPLLQEIFRQAKPAVAAPDFSLDNFTANNPKFSEEIALLTFAVENELATIPEWKLEEIKKQFFGALRLELLKRKLGTLSSRIREAEQIGRLQEVRNLSSEFNNLSKELAKLHAQ